MTIRPKMRVLLCSQPFLHYEFMGKHFGAQVQVTLHSEYSDLAQNRTSPRCYACTGYLQVKRRANQTWKRYRVHNIFPIISLLEFLVAVEIRVLIEFATKPFAAFPRPQWCFIINMIKIGHLASEVFKFKSVDYDVRMTNHCYRQKAYLDSLQFRWG